MKSASEIGRVNEPLTDTHLQSGSNVIKLLTVVIYECVRMFVPGNPFQPRLMFTGKARSLP